MEKTISMVEKPWYFGETMVEQKPWLKVYYEFWKKASASFTLYSYISFVTLQPTSSCWFHPAEELSSGSLQSDAPEV